MARTPIHPGEILADELEALDVSPAELARALDVPANRVTQILKGQRAITADTALRLGRWLGTAPQFWLNLQSQYELRIAENESGSAIRRHIKPLSPSDNSANL
jgi:addiction module HigA family antidote